MLKSRFQEGHGAPVLPPFYRHASLCFQNIEDTKSEYYFSFYDI